MDELDRFIDEVERELEGTIKSMFESRSELFNRPMVYGFSVKIGPEGEPIIRTFGDKILRGDGFREPVYDQIVDEERHELKLIVELPGVEKEDIKLESLENEVMILAERGERRYKANIKLKSAVDPKSAHAVYRNGVLDVTFKLKSNANKGYRVKIE
ncbi:MAG: Hsp20 family protein [Nitrososphaerales archaeon]|nr:Hsp20 family protein [Nitrososphaerales archaeon]